LLSRPLQVWLGVLEAGIDVFQDDMDAEGGNVHVEVAHNVDIVVVYRIGEQKGHGELGESFGSGGRKGYDGLVDFDGIGRVGQRI
jgi:hypothetical protein